MIEHKGSAGVDSATNGIQRIIGNDLKGTISAHNKIIGKTELKCLSIHEKAKKNVNISMINQREWYQECVLSAAWIWQLIEGK